MSGFGEGGGCGNVALGWVFGLLASVICGVLIGVDGGIGGSAYIGCFVGAFVIAMIGDRWAFGSGIILGLVTVPLLFLAACFALLGAYISSD